MKFSKNKLYIETYIKCVNCGILIFEDSKKNMPQHSSENGRVYCSSWCVDWETERETRRVAEANAR